MIYQKAFAKGVQLCCLRTLCTPVLCFFIFCSIRGVILLVILQAGACIIDDICYLSGDVNPDDSALQCDPDTDNTAWTVVGRK